MTWFVYLFNVSGDKVPYVSIRNHNSDTIFANRNGSIKNILFELWCDECCERERTNKQNTNENGESKRHPIKQNERIGNKFDLFRKLEIDVGNINLANTCGFEKGWEWERGGAMKLGRVSLGRHPKMYYYCAAKVHLKKKFSPHRKMNLSLAGTRHFKKWT